MLTPVQEEHDVDAGVRKKEIDHAPVGDRSSSRSVSAGNCSRQSGKKSQKRFGMGRRRRKGTPDGASFHKSHSQVGTDGTGFLGMGSVGRSRLYHSLTSLDRTDKSLNNNDYNVKKVLEAVASDHSIVTDPRDNRKRRTVVLYRDECERFGFSIQSYVIKRLSTGPLEQVSYVDNVSFNSPASRSGLRSGDVILSINGRSMKEQSHEKLIEYVGSCREMRMVVLFENYVQRIELCSRAIALKKLLLDKQLQLDIASIQEERLLTGLSPLSDEEAFALSSKRGMSSSTLSVDRAYFEMDNESAISGYSSESIQEEQEDSYQLYRTTIQIGSVVTDQSIIHPSKSDNDNSSKSADKVTTRL